MIISLFASNVQAQDPVIASAKAVVVNDSTYTIKANLQIKEGWHVYGDNPDGLNAPTFTAGIETAQFKAAASFITKSIKQKDVLFKEAFVYTNSVDFEQSILIKGFQPDSLKIIISVNVAKADSFLAIEIPVSVALANGNWLSIAFTCSCHPSLKR